jgi:hypothetical protein
MEIVPLSDVQKVPKLVASSVASPQASRGMPKSRPVSPEKWLAPEGKVKAQIGTTTIKRGKWCPGFATRKLVDALNENCTA